MKKRGLIKIDWLTARMDFISANPCEAVHWMKYLRSKTDCSDQCVGHCLTHYLKLSMNFLRLHGIGVKELAFTQYDITTGHDCKVNRSFVNVVQ